jgi:hypothetical protein
MNVWKKITMRYVRNYDPKTKTFIADETKKPITFDTKEQLIHTMARYTDTNESDNPDEWYNKFIKYQNLTGTDTSVIKNEENEILARYWNDIVFINEDGNIVDIRQYWPEIVKTIYAVKSENIKILPSPIKKWHWKHHGPHPKWHTFCTYRNHVKYGQTIRNFSQTEEYADEKFEVKIRPKFKNRVLIGYWWDDFMRQGSTGWKQHKHKKQWEHRVIEKEKHNRNKQRKANKRGESIFE